MSLRPSARLKVESNGFPGFSGFEWEPYRSENLRGRTFSNLDRSGRIQHFHANPMPGGGPTSAWGPEAAARDTSNSSARDPDRAPAGQAVKRGIPTFSYNIINGSIASNYCAPSGRGYPKPPYPQPPIDRSAPLIQGSVQRLTIRPAHLTESNYENSWQAMHPPGGEGMGSAVLYASLGGGANRGQLAGPPGTVGGPAASGRHHLSFMASSGPLPMGTASSFAFGGVTGTGGRVTRAHSPERAVQRAYATSSSQIGAFASPALGGTGPLPKYVHRPRALCRETRYAESLRVGPKSTEGHDGQGTL